MSHLIPDDEKSSLVVKLIHDMEAFSVCLMQRNNLIVHGQIDQFFYTQKIAELKILLNEYQLAKDRLAEITGWLDEKYRLGLSRWMDDTHRLNEIEKEEGISRA